jgi:hypothetical protein
MPTTRSSVPRRCLIARSQIRENLPDGQGAL